jgi:hypothetical protein
MTVGYLLEWKGIGQAAFARLVQAVEWQMGVLDGDVVFDPQAGGRALVVGAWESAAEFSRFYTRHLLPALGEIGLPQPAVSSWKIPGVKATGLFDPQALVTVRNGPWFDPRAGQISGYGGSN